jgi:hypothetical protein
VPVDPDTGRRYGYLPRKAAQRKIVIRAELGKPWMLASLAVGAGILVLGATFLLSGPDAPGPPFVEQGRLTRYAEGDVTPLEDGSGWLDRRDGLRAVGGPVAYCPADGGWVDEEGQRYDPAGRAASGSDGLELRRVSVVDGRVYVHPSGARVPPADAAGSAAAAALGACPAPRALGEPATPDGL